ncbi:MAG: 6-pyruvoyl-tetrahydropterin synthase-related protein, partial [Chloroflexota bacterium]
AAFAPALIDFFITGDPTLAVKLVYALALCIAGAAVYAFVARRSGAGVGVIAALLYIYSPYIGLTAPHLLGDLPGVISLALIPALLWSTDRLLRANRPFDFPTLVLITTALLLTDVRAALVGWALVLVLLVWDRPDHPRRWFHPIGAGLLGTLLAAYFWLPVLAEADAVQWVTRAQAAPDLLTLLGLFTPLRLLDPGALIPAHQLTLGLALPIFALLSLIAHHRASFHYLFLAIGLVLIVLALAIFPSEVWLLGVITLCLSIGGSVLVTWKRAPLLLPILAVLILVTALPVWLAPRWSEQPIDTSPLAQVDYEQQGYGIAVLPDTDPLPTSILPDTAPDRALIASYRTGLINKAQQISNAQIGVLEHTTYGERLQVQTTDSLTLHILTPYFPGWTAHLNDATLDLTRSDDGLIDLNLPTPTRGELEITLDTTSARTSGWVIAWLALLLLVAITVLRTRRPSSNRDERFELLPRRDARLLSVVLLGFGAVLAIGAIPSAPLSIQPPPNYALAGSRSLDNRSDAGLEVLAYRLDDMTYHPGATINLTLYWHTLRFLADNYLVRVSLLDLTTGAYRQPTDLRQPGGYPTTRWLPREYVTDPYALALPTDFPPGNYSPAIEVCTSDCAPETRLTFFNGGGTTYGQVLVLPIILTVE